MTYSMSDILKDPEEESEYRFLYQLARWKSEGGRMLSGLDQQKATIFVIHIHAMPCFLCGLRNNVYEAAKTVRLPNVGERIYTCRGCGIRLHYFVALIVGIEPYRWTRPVDLIPSEVAASTTKWQENLDNLDMTEEQSS